MGSALVGAAISIGSVIYSQTASRTEKRKAKKQLKQIAKASGVNYADLKSDLDNIFSNQIEDNPNQYTDILGSLRVDRAEQPEAVEAPERRAIDKAAMKDRIREATGASDIVLDTDSNVYSSAIKDWQSATNADYLTYATKLKEAQAWLDNFDKQRADVRTAKQDINSMVKDLERKRLESLINLDVGALQTQGQLAAQGLQYV